MPSIRITTVYLAVALLCVTAGTYVVDAAHLPQTALDALNFALNLECLEGHFYSCAYYGEPLSDELTGGGPVPDGCQKAELSGLYKKVAKNIADDEIAHVAFLRAVLGAGAVPCPKVELDKAFEAAANVALNTTLDPPFNPYANDLFFLHAAFIFEDVGVTAYKGAVPILLSTMGEGYTPDELYVDILENAAGILGTEAYHAGAIRTFLLEEMNTVVDPYGAKVRQIIRAISKLRDQLDGSGENDDKGIAFKHAPLLVPGDENAVVFSRSPEEVLKIVYGGDKPGLFFPNGLNGNIA